MNITSNIKPNSGHILEIAFRQLGPNQSLWHVPVAMLKIKYSPKNMAYRDPFNRGEL